MHRPWTGWMIVLIGIAACAGCGMVTSGENMRGVTYYKQGYYDAAGQRFLQAINADPRNADAYYNLASTHHQLWKARGNASDAQQAESLYHQCLDIDRDHRECYRGLAALLVEKGDPNAAFRLMTNWANESPRPAEAKVELARLYEELGDPREARNRLGEAIQLDPRNERALASLARLQEQSGETVQALTNYMRAYELDRSRTDVAQRIAALQTTTGGVPTLPPLPPSPALPGGDDGARVVANPGARLPRY